MVQGGTAPAVPSFARMTEAEARDLHLFIAPGRLDRFRRRLAAGLFQPDRPEALDAGNDNPG